MLSTCMLWLLLLREGVSEGEAWATACRRCRETCSMRRRRGGAGGELAGAGAPLACAWPTGQGGGHRAWSTRNRAQGLEH